MSAVGPDRRGNERQSRTLFFPSTFWNPWSGRTMACLHVEQE